MKSKIAIFILLAISIFIHWRWVFIPKLFGAGDFAYFLKFPQTWMELATPPGTWDPIWGNGFGTFNVIMFMYPVYFIIGLLSKWGLDLIWILKLTNFLPLIILVPLSSYLLARRVSNSILGGFVGSIVYSYNAYILLLQKGGILLTVIAYALVPLFFYFTSESLEKSSYKKALLAGLVGMAISIFDFRFFYLTSLLQAVYLIWNLLKNRFHKPIFTIVTLSLPIIIAVLLNCYWILPIALSGKVNHNIAISTGLFGGDMNLSQSLAFFHPYWDSGRNALPGTVQPTPAYLFMLPILAIFGLLKVKRFPDLSFYLIVLIAGIILTKQAAPPFPNLYLWLFKNFPGFNAFRESSKFYLYTALGYSVLLAASTAVFQKSPRKFVKYALISFLCLIFLLDTKSLVTGRIKDMFQPKDTPVDYQVFAKKISQDKDFYRVMWVPTNSQWSYADTNHPKVSAYLVYMEKLQRLLAQYPHYKQVVNPSTKTSHNYEILNVFNQDISPTYLQLLGIKYIAVPPVDSIKTDDLFNDIYGIYSDRPALINFLNSLSYATKEPSISGIDLYSLKKPISKMYTTNVPINLENLSAISPITYKRNNSVKYQIQLSNESQTQFLHFSESADSGWTLIEDNKSNALFPHDEPSEKLGLNSFKIDQNPNLEPGSKRNFTLYYAPQKFVNDGLIISGISLLAILLYLILPKTKI